MISITEPAPVAAIPILLTLLRGYGPDVDVGNLLDMNPILDQNSGTMSSSQ